MVEIESNTMSDFLSLTPPSLQLVNPFMEKLETLRFSMEREEWREFAKTDSAVLQWRQFLCKDPYTKWGFEKPRGYAGDAALMDLAYGHPTIKTLLDNACDAGREIYKYLNP
jgi:extracellular factor (EF) 3-hydroxypalmitic acid methyl ester biosynthesis protein